MFNHILQNWKTSLAGLLIATATICGVLSQQGITLGHAGTGTVVALVAAISVALLGLILKDPGNGTKVGAVLLAVALLSVAAHAQTLNTQATASVFHYQSSWFAGTEQTQSFPLAYFGAQKGQVISLGAREVIAPNQFSIYGAVGNYQPDLSKLMAKTTFNPDQFNVSFDVMGGVATLPNNVSKPSIEGRVNINYALNPNVALTGAYAGGGLIGSNRFTVFSAGIAYIFGAQNVQSMSVKRILKRQAARKMAIQMSGGQ